MNDLISRQDLLDKLEQWQKQDGYDNEEWNLLVDVITEIKNMPFATDIYVGTNDAISRQAAINAIDECYCGGEDSCGEPWIYKENAVEAINMIESILSVEPKRETTTLRIGRTRNSVTMWYECAECGEPVDQEDAFCRRCGRGIIHE